MGNHEMRRLLICLGALALSLSLGACATTEPQNAPAPPAPSVNVKMDLTIKLKGDRRVTGVTLAPSGHPSGVVALQTVHDGRVTTIGSQRFDMLGDLAYLAIQISPRDIELGWNIQGAQSSSRVAFPAGSVWSGGSYENLTIGSEIAGVDYAFFTLTRYVGKASASGSSVNDVSAASVAASRKHPTETAYCVTITLDGR